MKNNLPDKQSNFLLYTGSDGKVNVEVFLKDETVWLTQKEIGRLFGKSKATISEHLKKIYAEGELQMDSTVRKFRTVQMEDWVQFLHNFLELSNYPILEDKGKVSAIEAKLKAEQEYDSYRRQQDREFISDFDREIKRIHGKQENNDE